jgi:hypothetical protein
MDHMPHEIRDVGDGDTSAVGIVIRLLTPNAQQYAAMVNAGADWNSGIGWYPPAAENLPHALLDDATEGARMYDAMASSAPARNLLAHALHHLSRKGWISRTPRKPGDRVEDGGTMGTLVRCPQCGDGLLHDPDERPPSPAPAAEPDVEVNPSTLAAMQAIAAVWPAVEYDALDRPEEVAAVLAAARAAGLVAVPSETINPRTFRGRALPTSPASVAEQWALDPAAAAAAIGLHIDADAAGEAAVQSVLVAVTDALGPLLTSLWHGGLTVGRIAVAPAAGGQ